MAMALLMVLAMSSSGLSVYAADTANDGLPVPGSVNPDAPIDLPVDAARAAAPAVKEPPSGIHLTFTPPAGGAESPGSVNSSGAASSQKPDSTAADTAAATTDGQKTAGTAKAPAAADANAETAGAPDKTAIAQNQPLTTSASRTKTHLPTVTGTVTNRKPFKLVAKESLIHNISFRDTPVKEVLAEIARRGSLNVIFDKSVDGTITGEMRDVTLNEAFDSALAAAGLQTRVLDNNTVIVASPAALIGLGLGRTTTRAFKLSYAQPYDIAALLQNTIFNKGAIPYLPSTKNLIPGVQPDPSLVKDPTVKQIYTARTMTQEGVGFNNAATDPGSQQIRSSVENMYTYQLDQNGGGPIAIPDAKNRQVIVIGSADDVAVAEEAIHLLDRRPTQVHIQASLVELTNAGIRQLGANLNVQGDGASTSIMGNSTAPLVQFLPGLGSPFSLSPPALPFGNNVTPTSQTTAFSGLIGSAVPLTAPSIAGVNASTVAQSAFNFLTLGKSAGGRANIATAPTALNVSLNLLLQTNKAKVVANPSVVVSDNTETLITIANEVIHKVTSTVSLGVVTTNVELTKAGVFLNVVPRVTEDGFVVMRLRPQVSAPIGPPETFGTTTVTLLSVRDVMTQEVRMKDGQTLVIGGLFQEQEAANLAKVPYLAEAPVLGALFRNTLKGRNRTELMLLITPKIVEEDPTLPSASLSGQAPSPTM